MICHTRKYKDERSTLLSFCLLVFVQMDRILIDQKTESLNEVLSYHFYKKYRFVARRYQKDGSKSNVP